VCALRPGEGNVTDDPKIRLLSTCPLGNRFNSSWTALLPPSYFDPVVASIALSQFVIRFLCGVVDKGNESTAECCLSFGLAFI